MTKKTKVISLALSTAMVLSSFGAYAVAETTYEKVVDLKTADTVFNRIVATGAPADVEVYYSDDDGATWLNLDLSKQDGATGNSGFINADCVIGYLHYNGTTGVTNKINCTYQEFSADKIKLVSATESLDNVSVKVYNADDVAPTSDEIKADNSYLTAVAADGTTVLNTQYILDGARFNNPEWSSTAYIYNKDASETDISSTNTKAVLTMRLTKTSDISQVSFGSIHAGFTQEQAVIGTAYTVEYNVNDSWVSVADVTSRKNHAVINNVSTVEDVSAIRVTFTFYDRLNQLSFSYMGAYDFGDNLAVADNFSSAVDLGKEITFNTLNSAERVDWQYSLDGNEWLAYEEGTDMTAQYIRAASDEGIEETPAFDLSWEGNLLKYANEGMNGATVESPHGGNWATAYDGLYNAYTSMFPNYSRNSVTFNFKAPAVINSVEEYWQGGCWYPKSSTIETSNQGTTWTMQSERMFELKTTDGVHVEATDHNPAMNDYRSLDGVNAAMLKITYLESMRNVCKNVTGMCTNISEMTIDGAVALATYDCTSVTYPEIGSDETEDPEETATPEPTTAPTAEPTATPEPTEEPTPATYVNKFVANITPETNESITAGTSATAVLSEITPNDQTIKSVAWTVSEKTGTYATGAGAEISGAGTVKFGLIIDWSTEGLPSAFTGLSNGDVITSITTVIE